MEADATFAWAARHVVLHAIAGEHLNRSIVAADRTGHGKNPLGRRQHRPPGRVQAHRLIDAIEIQMRVLPELRVLLVAGRRQPIGARGGCHIDLIG